MSEHTPLLWKLAGIPDNMIVCDAEGGSIADCAPPGPWMRDKEALANAAFIVKAANHFDYLVEALERVVRDINEYEKSNNLAPNPGRTECWDSVAYAKAVLASIKETAT